jgi:hypothetical protein
MGQFIASTSEAVREILGQACAHRELLILVTPYLRFESNFLLLEEGVLHARVTMGAEEATYGLRNADLRFRFPHATRFLEGRTRMLGFGMVEGRRSLRLEIPKTLQDDDHRGAYRAERVGRVEVSFSTPRFELRTGLLANLSTTGARIHHSHESLENHFKAGDAITVTVPLGEGLRINGTALVRWTQGRGMGVEFVPVLPEPVLTPLSRWIFQRREEDKDRLRGLSAPLSPAPTSGEGGLVLVSNAQDLEQSLRETLVDLPPLRRVPPTVAALKEAVMSHPALLLFHLSNLGLDHRRHLKALAELLPARQPFMLVGQGVEAATLMELGTELKASAAVVLGPKIGPFFLRLVQGILRRHYEGGEGVLAPKEPS